MTKIFAEQFKLLSESFQTTFQELFGGGTARLELEDEEDILGCGIEIKAQPPGKTLKTISLLSGGEKAFVAIALYFSILKVHPTPFCVMTRSRRLWMTPTSPATPAICGRWQAGLSSSSSPTAGEPWRRPTSSMASPCRSRA